MSKHQVKAESRPHRHRRVRHGHAESAGAVGIPAERRRAMESTRASSTTRRTFARNLTDGDMVGRAVPSIAPGEAAKYFKKTECFCFTAQEFGPGVRIEGHAVRFVVDTGPAGTRRSGHAFYTRSSRTRKLHSLSCNGAIEIRQRISQMAQSHLTSITSRTERNGQSSASIGLFTLFMGVSNWLNGSGGASTVCLAAGGTRSSSR